MYINVLLGWIHGSYVAMNLDDWSISKTIYAPAMSSNQTWQWEIHHLMTDDGPSYKAPWRGGDFPATFDYTAG